MVIKDIDLLVDLFHDYKNITSAAKRYCELMNLEYSDSFRRKCSKILNRELDMELEEENDLGVTTLSALKVDGTIMSIKEYCETYKIPLEQVKTFKLVTHSGKGAYYNITSNVIESEGWKEFTNQLLEDISNMPGLPTTVLRTQKVQSEGHLLVVDPCDIHLGKLSDSFETGEEYNSQIAVQRVLEGVQGIIEKSKGFHINKVLFVGGNDVLHTDTPRATTTKGTPQDTDGMWYSNFLMAKDLYIEVLDKLLEIADVHFVYNPSNHDYMSSFFLADVIKTYYKDCKNITFDCDITHRKYFKYGQNLIGTTHGDGAKQADLPLLMANEAKDWSSCKHRYIYSHHIHHKVSKDYIGVTFEAMRSPSAADGWHSKNGYTGVPQAIEGFIHHPNFGQIARLTHIF